MNKINVKISLTITSLVLLFSACSKDNEQDDVSSGNSNKGYTPALFNTNVNYGSMVDQDGIEYKTVIIGTQTWMAENLRSKKYNDGTPISNVTDDIKWSQLTSGAYCSYSNTNNSDTIVNYGYLYNWYAVNTGKLAPQGWHVPSHTDLNLLIEYLGGINVAGGKIKEIGTIHWASPNTGTTNESGFTALPGGTRGYSGLFGSIGSHCNIWSSTEYHNNYAWILNIGFIGSSVTIGNFNKEFGFSVRCVKD